MQKDILDQLHKWYEALNAQKQLCYNDLPALDLYMDQVVSVVESFLAPYFDDTAKLITPSIINNYVKLDIIPSPTKKKYSREHIAKLIIVCVLKQVLPIPSIKTLMDTQLKKLPINDFFDLFCAQLHTILCSMIETEQYSPDTPAEDKIDRILLELAIKAGSGKIIADRLLLSYEEPIKKKKQNG